MLDDCIVGALKIQHVVSRLGLFVSNVPQVHVEGFWDVNLGSAMYRSFEYLLAIEIGVEVAGGACCAEVVLSCALGMDTGGALSGAILDSL